MFARKRRVNWCQLRAQRLLPQLSLMRRILLQNNVLDISRSFSSAQCRANVQGEVEWSVLTQASPFGERASTRSLPYFALAFALCFALAVHSTVEQPQVFHNANAYFVLAARSLQPPYDLCTLAASLWLCADSDRNSELNLNMWDRVAHSACWANVPWSIHKRCILW